MKLPMQIIFLVFLYKIKILLKNLIFTIACLFFCKFSFAQTNKTLAEKYAKIHFQTYQEFLSIPSDAHFPADLEKNKSWVENQFSKRGFSLQTLATPTFPLLLAERKSKNINAKTVLIYLQIDGQPVIPAEWQQKNPWIPALKMQLPDGQWKEISYDTLTKTFDRDWRIFARAAADAKGPDVMFLAALDAVQELGIDPNFNMKVIMDFEEELGSPQMNMAVEKYKKEFAADMFIIFDGPPHISNEPTLNFGARGIVVFTLTTYGAKLNMHSGNYGNYVPNPALKMAKLLASMKSDDGKVTIPHFYDGIKISATMKKNLDNVPDNISEINKKIGIKEAEKVASTFQEAMQYPTLNIRGLKSGEVLEKANTIIPNKAIAELDVRLPIETQPEKVVELLKVHIQSQGFMVLDHEPSDAERQAFANICTFKYDINYRAFRTTLDAPVGQWLERAIIKAHGKKPIKIPTVGGSIPISPFVVKLGIDAVAVPTVNPDNSQHSPNENLRIGNFIDGIQTMIAILSEKLR
jgi:acetylornithine deacetylase/succinyl-diaminopimelate desuccinylase-like protein